VKHKIVLQKSDEGYYVSCPGLPGCWSQGETDQEVISLYYADPDGNQIEFQVDNGCPDYATALQTQNFYSATFMSPCRHCGARSPVCCLGVSAKTAIVRKTNRIGGYQ